MSRNHYIDGRTGTRLYNIWRGMKKRCADAGNPKYGGRGIRLCSEWEDFPTFRAWAIASGYTDHLTIERGDNDGNYAPGNCSWIAKSQQARNRRTTRLITLEGETLCLAAWCERRGLPYPRVLARIDKLGWSPARALELA